MRRRIQVAAAIAAGIIAAQSSQAAFLYGTDFNGPTYANGGLIGQDGWVITGTSLVSPVSVVNVAVDGNVPLVNTGQDVNRPFTAVTSDSVFVSANINLAAAGAAGDYFLHLADGGSNNFNDRIYAKASGSGYVMAEGTGAGTVTYGTTVLSFGTTYHLLSRLDIVAGTLNDTGALYIDPSTSDGSGDTPYVLATTIGADAVSISSVNLRQGGGNSAPAVTSIDNINVFSQASAPEPATLALLLPAGLLALRRRARRRA